MLIRLSRRILAAMPRHIFAFAAATPAALFFFSRHGHADFQRHATSLMPTIALPYLRYAFVSRRCCLRRVIFDVYARCDAAPLRTRHFSPLCFGAVCRHGAMLPRERRHCYAVLSLLCHRSRSTPRHHSFAYARRAGSVLSAAKRFVH